MIQLKKTNQDKLVTDSEALSMLNETKSNVSGFNERANQVCEQVNDGVRDSINGVVNQLNDMFNKLSASLTGAINQSINSVSGNSECFPFIEEAVSFVDQQSADESYDITIYNKTTGFISTDSINNQ